MEFLASLPTLKNRGNHPDGEENKKKKKRVRMKQWNKQQFGDTSKRVHHLEYELNKLEVGSNDR